MSNRVRLTLQQASEQLPALVEQAMRGQDVVLTDGGQAVARIVPVDPEPAAKPLVGSGKGTVLFMADDFDAPLEDFRDYSE